jgi:hypothetical protein
MIVSDDDAARRRLRDASLGAQWQTGADPVPSLTAAVAHVQAAACGALAPECLVIDDHARYDQVHHAIAAIRRCDAGEPLPIVVLSTALRSASPTDHPYTFGVLRIHLMSHDLAALGSMARALRRILAGRGDLFRRGGWIRADELPRLAHPVGSAR